MKKKNALNKLIDMQELLGALEFTLTNDQVYYKDYGLQDGVTMRVVPHFDKGTSSSKNFEVTGFSVMTNRFVSVTDLVADNVQFSKECISDLIAIATKTGSTELYKRFIVNEACSECSKLVSSFVLVDNKFYCVRCAK
jgi:hypothetical protein